MAHKFRDSATFCKILISMITISVKCVTMEITKFIDHGYLELYGNGHLDTKTTRDAVLSYPIDALYCVK